MANPAPPKAVPPPPGAGGTAADLLAEEQALGGSHQGVALNAMLRALSRAARSFLLYDPRNEAIRAFLADYEDKARAALGYGDFTLDVRPFELVLLGEGGQREVVYLERERERSLAFRLFRDGVRSLTVHSDAPWEELLRFLEILSIRYTGIRQQEDDIVTLLFKAAFKRIDVVAVEGFLPEEDEARGDGGDDPGDPAAPSARHRVDAPPGWDQPLPSLADPVGYALRDIDDERLARLRAEVGSHTVADDALHLLRSVALLVEDPVDPTGPDLFVQLAGELRDFLLAEGQLVKLLELVRRVQEARRLAPEPLDALLLTFTDRRAMERVLRTVGSDQDQSLHELVVLLEVVPADHLPELLDLLSVLRGTAERRGLRQLLEHYGRGREDELLARLAATPDGEVAADLLAALCAAAPDRAAEACAAVVDRPEPELGYEVMRVVADLADGTTRLGLLGRLLESGSQDVRIKAVAQIATIGGVGVFEALRQRVEQQALTLSRPEAESLGRALAALDANRTAVVVTEWIRPAGFFSRFVEMPGRQTLQWAGVSAIAALPGQRDDGGDKLLRWLADRAGEELHRHCLRALAGRPRVGGVAGGQ